MRAATVASLLVALLLFAQLGLLGHFISHLQTGQMNDEPSGRVDSVCVWCAAYAQQGHALAARAIEIPHNDFVHAMVRLSTCHTVSAHTWLAYHSQAPPQFS